MRSGDHQPADRDRALRRTASWTAGGVAGAAGLTVAISAASAAGFAAATHTSAPAAVPVIPIETVPSQSQRPTPAVIVQVIHVAGATVRGRAGTSLSPPKRAPGPVAAVPASGGQAGSAPPPPPPPPPPPVCHSTPSHPC
jgi:hypothetical protein